MPIEAASALLDSLLLTKGKRRYAVQARSEVSLVVEAPDVTTAHAIALKELADTRPGPWLIERVQALNEE